MASGGRPKRREASGTQKKESKEAMTIDQPTDVSLYVLRDSISREIIAAWPATGHRAPGDPTWLVNRYIQADPDLRCRRLRYRRERHQVSDLASQILIACL